MKKKYLLYILFLILFLVIGFYGGYLLATNNIVENLTPKDLLILFLSFILIQFLVINIHEFGHFLFGKLLGYQLIMYQIGPLAFTYENGKMKFRLKRAKGFAGLCAMIPSKDTNSLEKKHLFYYAGGIILNLLTGLASLLVLPFISSLNGQLSIFLFAGISILLGLTNLIPYQTSGNHFSDGKIIFGILRQDPNTVAMLTLQNTFTQLAGGIRPSKLIIEDSQLAGEHDPSLVLLQYFQAMDQDESARAIDLAKRLIKLLDKVPSVTLPGFYYELITAGILFNQPTWIETYYPLAEKTLKSDRDLNGERVKAYYSWYTGNETQALQHIEQAKSVANKFPIRGQIKMELMLIDKLAEKLQQNEQAVQ